MATLLQDFLLLEMNFLVAIDSRKMIKQIIRWFAIFIFFSRKQNFNSHSVSLEIFYYFNKT